MTHQRQDIQALRGFAVLIVLFYHAHVGPFDSGYLGVDIFFVISGFLITSNIKNSILNGSFSFYEFYYRRAKRLLPAAYVTFFVVAILASLLLTELELAEFRLQLLGAVTFTANIVLAQQSGYFDGESETKPLLHVWSLAVEEQYYILLPMALFFLPKRLWIHLAAAACLLSFALSQAMIGSHPTDTFFLLPTRAWELMIGSLGALMVASPRTDRVLNISFFPALLVLLAAPFLPATRAHPGLGTLVVCVATLAVILRHHPILNTSAAITGLARVGDFSYSLYLVHWPLFSFANTIWLGDTPGFARASALILSLLLGYLLYRFVEQPFRHMKSRMAPGALGMAFAISTAVVVSPALYGLYQTSSTDYAHLRRPNRGFGAACSFSGGFKDIRECRNADEPTLLVWGDSHAMHLIPGLAKLGAKVDQATMSACGPFLDVMQIGTRSRRWAERCITFNRAVADHLTQSDSIKTVVLAGHLTKYMSTENSRALRRRDDGTYEEINAGPHEYLGAFSRSIEAARKAGKKIVIVASPPQASFNVGECLERKLTGKLMMGVPADCAIPVEGSNRFRLQDAVSAFLDEIGKSADVNVIRFDDALCNEKFCKSFVQDVMLYRDRGHLSHAGSEVLADIMQLPTLIEKNAR